MRPVEASGGVDEVAAAIWSEVLVHWPELGVAG